MYISKDSLKRRCAFYSVAGKFEEINQNDQIKSLDSFKIMSSNFNTKEIHAYFTTTKHLN